MSSLSPRHLLRRHTPGRRCVLLLAVFLTAIGAGCGSDEGGQDTALDRETFIATWIDLRQAALQSSTGEASPAQVETILQEHGTTAEEMEEYARVRGEDAAYMRGVWEEVERRMRVEAGEMPADSGAVPDGAGAA